MLLSAGSAENIKPELVLDAFYQSRGEERPPFAFLIHREDVYARRPDGKDANAGRPDGESTKTERSDRERADKGAPDKEMRFVSLEGLGEAPWKS